MCRPIPSRHRGSALALFALSLVAFGCAEEPPEGTESGPGSVFAQGTPPGGADPHAELANTPLSEMNAEELQAEYARIQMRLAPLQQQALEDPQLKQAFAALEKSVSAKMDEMDPNMPGHRSRLEEIGLEFEAARATEDEDKMNALRDESSALQNKLRQAQIAALESEDVFAEMEVFQNDVVARMNQIDPAAEDLIDRASQIVDRLRTEEPSPQGQPGEEAPSGEAP